MNKRRFLALPVVALAGLSLMSASGTASAQQFPSRPVTYIVPWVPGGSSDTTARVLATFENERAIVNAIMKRQGK